MIPIESFKIVFPDVSMLLRKDFELVDPTIIDPLGGSVLLYQGEWLNLYSTQGKLARNAAHGTANKMAFPVMSLRGDYNIQYSKLVPVILGNKYVADTLVFDRGAGVINALGQALSAELIAFDGGNRSILTAPAGGDATVAYVLELPGSATAPLRILGGY